MNKVIAAIKTWYAQLPNWAKGAVTAAEAGALGFLVQWAMYPGPICLSKDCLKQFIGGLGVAVVVAIRNWVKQSPLVPQAQKDQQQVPVNPTDPSVKPNP